MLFFFFFFFFFSEKKNRICNFMQIIGDNWPEISNPVSLEKNKKTYFKMSSAKYFYPECSVFTLFAMGLLIVRPVICDKP